MSDQTRPQPGPQREISIEQASRMLRMGLAEPVRPVDALLERLGRPDGSAWLSAALVAGPAAAFGHPEELMAGGKATLEQLRAIKQAGTRQASDESYGAHWPAMICYFFAIAAGLAHFGVNLSSRPPAELEAVLLDLAAVTPPVWSELFVRAANALPTLS